MRCVSPLLMGAVLALCSGIDVYAATEVYLEPEEVQVINDKKKQGNISGWYDNFDIYPTSIDVIDTSSGITIGSFDINSKSNYYSLSNYQGSTIGFEPPDYQVDGQTINFNKSYVFYANYDYDYNFAFRLSPIDNKHIRKLQMNTTPIIKYIIPNSGSGYINFTGDFSYLDFWGTSNNWVQYGRFDLNGVMTKYFTINIKLSRTVTSSSFSLNDFIYKFQVSFPSAETHDYNIYCVYDESYDEQFSSIGENVDKTEDNTSQIADQQQQYHDQDQSDATSAGQAMSGVATDLENVKNKWEILWYPIEFTNNLMSAFQGTQAAAYDLSYGNISGYTYNESSGLLEPVYTKVRSSSSGSATITFPEYTLPVLNVKLWDSYSYDMSTLKDQFPALFDTLYVFVSMIEVFMFVGFLRKKYEEVFRR